MQRRKVYVPGAAVLLVALLGGCTSGSGHDDDGDDKSGDTGASTTAAEPGRYRTLPEPCGAVDHSTLDAMLPGIAEIKDAGQREKAYGGSPTVTYDTDRRVGCRWKVESPDATHHLLVDFERVVSYDGAVSDDARAQEVYRTKLREADVPEPSASGSEEESPSPSGSEGSDEPEGTQGPKKSKGSEKPQGSEGTQVAARAQGGAAAEVGMGDGTEPGDTPDPEATPEGLESRTLDDLGDEAFLADVLSTASSASRHRTVTVVFRTSNVVVTVEYDEQPARRTEVPDSKEMQDNARELAENLTDRFNG
ncbi:DUF3558 domain-containing protein [Streptomyces sp. NPDC053474]|uniref:DUF3558 domain-containing protein n=1 Tax=Streptomyces sp. NPDC053474 TaxID=3365704 RepID=UPI0037D459CF